VPADTEMPDPLANFIDALGRRVTAEPTRSGLLAILTRTPDKGLRGGHPALDVDNARVLRDALTAFIGDGEPR
jgi:hypothetical protein